MNRFYLCVTWCVLAIGWTAACDDGAGSDSPTAPTVEYLVNCRPPTGDFVLVCHNPVVNECAEYVFGNRPVWEEFTARCELDGGIVQVVGTLSNEAPESSWNRHPCRQRAAGGFCALDANDWWARFYDYSNDAPSTCSINGGNWCE